jgi:hypothetical protein
MFGCDICTGVESLTPPSCTQVSDHAGTFDESSDIERDGTVIDIEFEIERCESDSEQDNDGCTEEIDCSIGGEIVLEIAAVVDDLIIFDTGG